MRRAARVDANQAAVIAALRRIGATVQPLHTIGRGCPDLIVGYQGKNLLIEVKDGSKPPSKRALTADERMWHLGWRGTVVVVETVGDAISAVGANST